MALTIKEHPLRRVVCNELHVRSFQPVQAPARVSHLAILCGERGSGINGNHLRKLLEHFAIPAPDNLGQYLTADLGGIRLHWERHTEFVSYTFTQQGSFEHPFANPVVELMPAQWLASFPGEVVSAVSLAIESPQMPERSQDAISALFAGNTVIGCEVVGGKGKAWSDLRIHFDGYSRILVRNDSLSNAQAGRLIKRLLEVNSYRAMALLALPPARTASRTLADADRALADLSARLTGHMGQDLNESQGALLSDLTQLASQIETLAAQNSYRFEASRAYYGVVTQRLQELRQQRIEGLQTFTEFLDARLAPAIATCESVIARQRSLGQRAARLTGLLRARVEVGLQAQNRNLLESMDKRAQLQIRLQETVEGLSVIAISYYGVSLLGYVLKALSDGGLPINHNIGIGVLAPLVVFGAWLFLQRVKKRIFLSSGHGGHGSGKA